jgi:hypothetical protein
VSVDAITLLKDGLDQRGGQDSGDEHLKADGGQLSLTRLKRILTDIENQPAWRAQADKACDYYDGNQLDAETAQKLAERGLGSLITNLVKPTIDAVLGLEVRTRTDWKVVSDDEQNVDVADFLSAKIKEAERETRADRAISDAYSPQIKAGMGWVEVSRSTNPFDYNYRVTPVHRREIWWDWQATKPDLSDARYLRRRRALDSDVVAAHFPKHASLIQYASKNWPDDWLVSPSLSETQIQLLTDGYNTERGSQFRDDWRDLERGMVYIDEVWYRTWHRGAVLWLNDGRKVEYDERNPVHIAAVASQRVQVKVGVFDKLRVAFFMGPHRIEDYATNRRRFPYVPFWGFREDLTGIPYGLIRSMISPQDEVNARRAKMMWLLSNSRVMIDSDAIDPKYMTLSQVSAEIRRPDAYIIRNPVRANGRDAIQVDENQELSQFQFRLLEEAKGSVQEAGGVYAALMGQNSNATSGAAIQGLIDQGTMTLAEINDNKMLGQRMVGELLLDMIREDYRGQMQEMMVDTGVAKRLVQVNVPAIDESTGMNYMANDVTKAAVKVTLDDVPSTPSYRAQQLAQLSEVTKSLPPQMQAFVVPFMIEATDMPKRKQIAAILRKQLGIADDPDSPEAQQAAQQQQQVQQEQMALEMKKLASEIAKNEATAAELMAKAKSLEASIGAGDGGEAQRAMDQQSQQFRDEIARLNGELVTVRTDAMMRIDEARIKAEADLERARIDKEREQIKAEAQIEAARISAEAQAKSNEVAKQIADLTRAFEDKLRASEEKHAAAVQKLKDDQDAKESEDEDEKPEPAEPAEPMTMNLTVNVDAKPTAKKVITIKKGQDGTTTAQVDEEGE